MSEFKMTQPIQSAEMREELAMVRRTMPIIEAVMRAVEQAWRACVRLLMKARW